MDQIDQDFRDMRNLKNFSIEETSVIRDNRKKLAYRVSGNNKTVANFTSCLEFEHCLHKLVKRCRTKYGENTEELEKRLVERIKSLYNKATQSFPMEKSFYLNYFKFCQDMDVVNLQNNVCNTMIKYHPDDEEILLTAARWYVHDRKEYNYALNKLQENIAKHSTYKLLRFEAMKYEMMKFISTPKQEHSGKHLMHQLSLNVKAMIDAKIDDASYFKNILIWLEKYNKFTLSLQKDIIMHLLNGCCNDKVLLWELLAEREKRGLHYSKSTKGEETIIFVTNHKDRLVNCINMYKEALNELSEYDKDDLETIYLNCLVTMSKDKTMIKNDRKSILVAFESLSKSSVCVYWDVSHYIAWLHIADKCERDSIFQKAIKQHPKATKLWHYKLSETMISDNVNEEDVLKIFSIGSAVLKQEALPLWTVMLQYMTLNHSEALEQFFQIALRVDSDISNAFKPKYLQYLSARGLTDKCREMYFKWVDKVPYNKELYQCMLTLELSKLSNDNPILERVLQLGCEQFGGTDVDVWLDYCHFCFSRLDQKAGERMVNKLIKKAIMALGEDKRGTLEQRYLELRSSFARKK